jgi:hypothetical protein
MALAEIEEGLDEPNTPDEPITRVRRVSRCGDCQTVYGLRETVRTLEGRLASGDQQEKPLKPALNTEQERQYGQVDHAWVYNPNSEPFNAFGRRPVRPHMLVQYNERLEEGTPAIQMLYDAEASENPLLRYGSF